MLRHIKYSCLFIVRTFSLPINLLFFVRTCTYVGMDIGIFHVIVRSLSQYYSSTYVAPYDRSFLSIMIRLNVFFTIIVLSTQSSIDSIGTTVDPRHELLTEIVGRLLFTKIFIYFK
jgi:hypothetical protein